jgi:Phytanoyl-CoA dioxygenase (PhyH)
MIKKLKRLVHLVLDSLMLPAAWFAYVVSGRTAAWGGHAMIRLFCATGGHTNDWMARAVSAFYPPRRIPAVPGVIPALSAAQLEQCRADLDRDGYHIFEQRIPPEICDRLYQFGVTQPAVLRPVEGQKRERILATYDQSRPRAICYDFVTGDLLANPDVQAILADTSIISLAQAYLNTEPVLDAVCMWWQTAFQDTPDGEAAQLYHFDMDRIKWLKFFVYLTDVGTANGPHTFVQGSHRTGAIPRDLLRKGYARLQDNEVEQHYPREKFVEFNAPRGTILAEDTRGLHKGKHVQSGGRLLLQIQFSSSMFGPSYVKNSLGKCVIPALVDKTKSNPRIYSAFS